MQTAYKMIGADGAEYGPATLSEFKQWVQEGRVNGSTLVARTDQDSWSTAASFPELGVTDAIGGASVEGEAADPVEAAELEKKIKSHGSWLYWIAGLSIINSIVAFAGSEWGFYLGFTVLQALEFAVSEASTAIRAGVLAFDVTLAGSFIALGLFACRQHAWAFVVGFTLYGLDTALTLFLLFFGGSFIGAALHSWALVSLVLGFSAALKLKKLRPAAPAAKPVVNTLPARAA